MARKRIFRFEYYLEEHIFLPMCIKIILCDFLVLSTLNYEEALYSPSLLSDENAKATKQLFKIIFLYPSHRANILQTKIDQMP